MPDERVRDLGAPERRHCPPPADTDPAQWRSRLCVFPYDAGDQRRIAAYYEGRCVLDTHERRGAGERGRRVHKWSSVYRDSMLAQKARAEC